MPPTAATIGAQTGKVAASNPPAISVPMPASAPISIVSQLLAKKLTTPLNIAFTAPFKMSITIGTTFSPTISIIEVNIFIIGPSSSDKVANKFPNNPLVSTVFAPSGVSTSFLPPNNAPPTPKVSISAMNVSKFFTNDIIAFSTIFMPDSNAGLLTNFISASPALLIPLVSFSRSDLGLFSPDSGSKSTSDPVMIDIN